MKNDKLHNIKSTGYKTPDQYFETFEQKLFKQLNDKATLKGIEETGFKTPKDYFDNLEDGIFSKIEHTDTPVLKLSNRKNRYYIAGIAASLILFLAVIIGSENDSGELSVEMVEAYFENSDLDTYEIAELFTDEDLKEDISIIETEFSEDNLEEYLLDNIDIETYLE